MSRPGDPTVTLEMSFRFVAMMIVSKSRLGFLAYD
jgi:hypothetical protein